MIINFNDKNKHPTKKQLELKPKESDIKTALG